MQEKAQQINKNIADHDAMEKLRKIQNQMSSPPDGLVIPSRYLVKEGQLIKLCKKKDKPRAIYLFNDSLLYATFMGDQIDNDNNKTLLLPKLYPLKGSVCRQQGSLEIVIQTNTKSFVLRAQNETSRDEWYLAITKVIEDLKDDAMARANDATKAAPVWVQDKQANECPYCHAEFTFINRRHHCRQCGKVVCNKCSTGREVLTNIDDTEL